MGSVKGNVDEEGVVAFLCHAEELDGVVTDDFAPVFAAFPESAEFRVGGIPGIFAFGEGTVVARIGLLGHAAADVVGDGEDVFGIRFDVPFAREVGVVSSSCELLGPEKVLFFIGGLEIPGGFFGLPEKDACVEHVAAGNADRYAPGTHVVSTTEVRATLGEAVEIRSFDFAVTERADRIEALVVREDEEEVGLVGSDCRERCGAGE